MKIVAASASEAQNEGTLVGTVSERVFGGEKTPVTQTTRLRLAADTALTSAL
jgi:hypothetical protein